MKTDLKQVLILHTRINPSTPYHHYAKYYSSLPRSVQLRIDAYRKETDKVAGIVGKQLLSDGLKVLGIEGNCLQSLYFKKNNRPYLTGLPQVDFNISHSGPLVVCALGIFVRVGIDVEKRRSINMSLLRTQLTGDQWEELHNSSHPQDLFYRYWVQKESLVKADGSDMPTIFSEIDIQANRAVLHNQTWYLNRILIDPDYESWLSVDDLPDIKVRQMRY